MKIRQGFVSNSSSSSFIIIGREIDIDNITVHSIKENQIIALGDHLYDGQDVFQIRTIEELAFLKSMNKLKSEKEFVFVEAYLSDDNDNSDGEFDVSILPKTGKVKFFTGSKDYSSSNDVNTLKQRYDDYGDISKHMQVYLRAKKIKKLEKNNE